MEASLCATSLTKKRWSSGQKPCYLTRRYSILRQGLCMSDVVDVDLGTAAPGRTEMIALWGDWLLVPVPVPVPVSISVPVPVPVPVSIFVPVAAVVCCPRTLTAVEHGPTRSYLRSYAAHPSPLTIHHSPSTIHHSPFTTFAVGLDSCPGSLVTLQPTDAKCLN
jgi:hypothetical protein